MAGHHFGSIGRGRVVGQQDVQIGAIRHLKIGNLSRF